MSISEERDDGFCEVNTDSLHCEHWWDGDSCCLCDHPEMTHEEMLEQGMEPLTDVTGVDV